MVEFGLPRAQGLLRRLVVEARDSIGSCHGAGIAVTWHHRVLESAATDGGRAGLDAQYASGAGPCLDAARHLQTFHLACISDVDDWQDFRRVALANRIRSSLSVPLSWRRHPLGALTSTPGSSTGSTTASKYLAAHFAQRTAEAIWRRFRPRPDGERLARVEA